MKNLLLVMLASAILLTGCVAKVDEKFVEFEKVDVEVSDYVETDEIVKEDIVDDAEKTEENKDNITEESPKVQEKAEEEKPPVTKVEEKSEQKTVEKEPVKETPKQPVKTEKVDYSKINLNGKIICIDAAHGIFTENKQEGIAPGLSLLKDGFKEGTKGANITEDEITLAVANVLKQKLEAKGATVLMTRTDQNASLSNVERAEFANNNGADICIKLHADGNKEGGSGMTMLVPGNKYISDKNLLVNSKRLGQTVLNGAIAKTGAIKRGVYTTSEMTGFNWSKIPVIVLEMGFLTNPQDEAKLSDANYQSLIADGIVEGILEYYR